MSVYTENERPIPPKPNPSTGNVGCGHKFVLLETYKKRESGYCGDRPPQYFRVDRFYCEKCLEIKEVSRKD